MQVRVDDARWRVRSPALSGAEIMELFAYTSIWPLYGKPVTGSMMVGSLSTSFSIVIDGMAIICACPLLKPDPFSMIADTDGVSQWHSIECALPAGSVICARSRNSFSWYSWPVLDSMQSDGVSPGRGSQLLRTLMLGLDTNPIH